MSRVTGRRMAACPTPGVVGRPGRRPRRPTGTNHHLRADSPWRTSRELPPPSPDHRWSLARENRPLGRTRLPLAEHPSNLPPDPFGLGDGSRPGRVDPSPRFQDRRRGSSPDVDQSAGDKRIAATDELPLGPTPVEGRRRHRRLEAQGTRASRIERRGTEPRRPGGAARGCRGPGVPEGPRNRPTHRFALRVASNADQSFGRAPARGKGGVSSPAVWRRLRGPGGHAWYSTQRRRPKAASSDVSRRRHWRRDTRKESGARTTSVPGRLKPALRHPQRLPDGGYRHGS
jgi:hypothetical protein